MRRCIELARNGLGTTYPNPLVGAVIVHNDVIIGEGWHRKAGEPHAEVNAVNSVKDKSLLQNATIYVSLEPCSHFGKTPPCCDLILAHHIPNIVVGTVDTFSQVAGNGIRKLREAGRNVIVGVLEEECRELNCRFFTFHEKKRPYVILKWAQSADGFLAPAMRDERRPVWITSPTSRRLVHKWRTEEQAILVGSQTAIDDDPKLDNRFWAGSGPTRILIDRNGRVPKESALFDGSAPTIVFTRDTNVTHDNASYLSIPFENTAREVLDALYGLGLQSVLIEGGRQTLELFLEAGLWDEARVLTGKTTFGNGVGAPQLNLPPVDSYHVEGDQIRIYRHD